MAAFAESRIIKTKVSVTCQVKGYPMACAFQKQILVSEFQRNKVFYPKRSRWADPWLRLLYVWVGVGKKGATAPIANCRGRLPGWRLSVKWCAKSDLRPDPTHLAAILFPSSLIRGGKSCPWCSHSGQGVVSCMFIWRSCSWCFHTPEGDRSSEVIYHSWTTHTLPWI